MTRLITISSIIALILAVTIGATLYAKDTRDALNVHIEKGAAACQSKDAKSLKDASNAMSELLKKRHSVLSLYVRHDETEKLETLHVVLAAYIDLGEFESASVTLSQIKFLANHIYQREALSLDNLF